jgi:hypothetical protein
VKITKYSIVFSLLILTMPCRLMAEPEKISFGNLKIIPSLSGQAIYDTNIYLKNGTDETTNKIEHDWIYHVMPGIMLNYTMPERGSINLGYQGDWAFYNNNTNNNWKSQKVMAGINYDAPGGMILGIDNLWTTTEDPYGSADQYALGRVTKRWNDDLKSKAGYNFGKVFKVLLFYNFYKQDYNDIVDYTQDYSSNEFGIGLETKIMSKTWGFVRYHYGQRYYNTFYGGLTSDFNSDFNWHRVNTGLSWDATAKLSGELNVGYMWKKYKNEFTDTTHTAMREDRNTWIAATSISYKPFTTTTLTLNIDRAVRDTNAGTNEYFDDTGVGLSLKQVLLTKFVFNLSGQYSRNEYNLPVTDNRVDNNYTAITGLDYNIQDWMTVGISYKFMKKNCNITVNEFRDEQFMATLKFLY